MASRLLPHGGKLAESAHTLMRHPVTGKADPTDWRHGRPALLTVRLWRRVAGRPQGLFTFAGTADAFVLAAVMQHVRQLTCAMPEWWRLEVFTIGFDGYLLRQVRALLRAVQSGASAAHWAQAPEMQAELHARRRCAARTALAPDLLH